MFNGLGYRVRTKAEQYDFFRRGRVFAMLWSETAGGSISRSDQTVFTAYPNSTFTRGRFGENIYSSIRRFVVMRVNRASHFVEAWYALRSIPLHEP
jgi:hypothetical protein